MRTCSTRNIEGCLCKSFSIQILGFKVTRDFAINNSRGCHVTSSCVINISTSRRLQMRCIRIIFNRVIIIKSTKFFDSKRCFNSRKCLSFTLWFCSYINHLRHLFKSFLSMFCLFAFFFFVVIQWYENAYFRYFGNAPSENAEREWIPRFDENAENFEVPKTRGNVMKHSRHDIVYKCRAQLDHRLIRMQFMRDPWFHFGINNLK